MYAIQSLRRLLNNLLGGSAMTEGDVISGVSVALPTYRLVVRIGRVGLLGYGDKY